MGRRLVPILVLALAATLTTVAAAPAGATPSKTTTCTSCHSGAASGTVTAAPSTATPAPGAAYTVSLSIGLTASGNTGFHIAQTDAAGTATTWQTVYGGPAAQTTWAPSMTAPSTPGTYYYKVWCVKGPASSSGMAKTALYSITVPALAATPAITSLTPAHAQTGASVVIAGTDLGAGGTVSFGRATATATAWSATCITAVVPAGLATGATSVTVTPAGAAVSNSLAFTVDAATPLPAPADTIAPVTIAAGLPATPWCNHAVTVSLTAADDTGGAGVASILYSVDGEASVPVAGTATDVPLTASGLHTVAFHAEDAAGNAERVKSVTVGIDLDKPQPVAPQAAKVRESRTATLRYLIRDETPNGGAATVQITIRNSRGKVVKRLSLGSRPVNTALAARFGCSLRPGTYRFLVRATDAAGNAEAAAAQQSLRVLAGN
jgi:hypothetical protein